MILYILMPSLFLEYEDYAKMIVTETFKEWGPSKYETSDPLLSMTSHRASKGESELKLLQYSSQNQE